MSSFLYALLVLWGNFVHSASSATLRVLLEKPPGELHPAKTVSLEGVMIANQVYDTLVKMGSGSQIMPNLAESWSYDERKQEMKLKLCDNILLSNGVKLTSEHIRKTFEGIISNKVFRNLDKISGAKTFRSGKTKTLPGFKVYNDREFSVRFDFFYPQFLEELADPYAAVYVETSNSKWPVGTGPYKVATVNHTTGAITLDSNPYFRGPKTPFDTLVLSSTPTNDVDISFVDPNTPSLSKRLADKIEYFDTEVYFIAFNASHENLINFDVRSTLASFLTPDMVDETLGKVAYPVGGFIPLGVLGHNPKLVVPQPTRLTKPKGTVVVWNYMKKLEPLAVRYCQELKSKGIKCVFKSLPLDSFFHTSALGQVFFARQKSTSYSPEYLMSCFVTGNYSNMFTHGEPEKDPITKLMNSLFDRVQEVHSGQPDELLRRYHDMDAKALELVLVKPFRYGANKLIWYRSGLKLPHLDTLGPFGFKFADVSTQASK